MTPELYSEINGNVIGAQNQTTNTNMLLNSLDVKPLLIWSIQAYGGLRHDMLNKLQISGTDKTLDLYPRAGV